MLYQFRCPKCQNIFEVYYKLEELVSSFPTTQCPKCSAIAQRLYTPPMTIMPLTPYYDHGLGRYINSRQERKQAMKELGVTEVGTEPLDLKKIERNREREQAKKEETLKTEALKLINRMEE